MKTYEVIHHRGAEIPADCKIKIDEKMRRRFADKLDVGKGKTPTAKTTAPVLLKVGTRFEIDNLPKHLTTVVAPVDAKGRIEADNAAESGKVREPTKKEIAEAAAGAIEAGDFDDAVKARAAALIREAQELVDGDPLHDAVADWLDANADDVEKTEEGGSDDGPSDDPDGGGADDDLLKQE